MKQEISSSALNNVFHKAVQKAIRENRALGLDTQRGKEGGWVKENPDGTIVHLGRKPRFGMVKVKKKRFTLK